MRRHAPTGIGLVLALSVLAIAFPPATATACANGHLRMSLSSFPPEAVSRAMYWFPEATAEQRFWIRVTGHGCSNSSGSVAYRADHETTEATDVALTPGRFTESDDPGGHQDYYGIPFQVLGDSDAPPDEPVEQATIVLDAPAGARVVQPSTAALVIVNDDGLTAAVSLAAGDYRQSESVANGGVPVFRAGPTASAVAVQYSVEGTGANPVSPGDVTSPATGTVTIPAGQRVAMIPVVVVNDDEKESDETLQVTISGGPEVTGTTMVPFTIVDNEEMAKPRSSLHHPNNRRKYAADDYRIREVHVFTEDTGEAGVVAAEFALRRNMRGGSCQWWTGKRFKKGGCADQRWLRTGTFGTDYFFYRLDQLKPSKRRIKNYSAFSRAIDGSNNVETRLEKGRNANTFEIKRPKG